MVRSLLQTPFSERQKFTPSCLIDCFLEGPTCIGSSRLAAELGRSAIKWYVHALGGSGGGGGGGSDELGM